MNAADLLDNLEQQGLVLTSPGGDRLNVRGPDNVLTDDVVTTILAQKPQLLALLTARQVPQYAVELGDQPYQYSIWSDQKLQGSLIAIDVETTKIEANTVPRVVLASVSDGQEHFIVEASRLENFILTHAERRYVCHHTAFDYWCIRQHLERCASPESTTAWWRVADEGRLRDTMLLDQLIRLAECDEHPVPRRLEVLAEQLLGWHLNKQDAPRTRFAEIEGLDLGQVNRGFLDYAICDAIATVCVYQSLLRRAGELQPDPQRLLPEAVRLFGPLTETIQVKAAIALAAVERQGLRVDQQQVKITKRNLHAAMTKLAGALEGSAGGDVVLLKRGKDDQVKLTPSGAPQLHKKQLATTLEQIASGFDDAVDVPRTEKTNLPTTSTKFWSQYAQRHPFIQTYCELATTAKLYGFFGKLSGERIHPRYSTLVRTGRTACSGPNIQQLPRRGGFREMIVASPGHLLFVIDYAALELRTLAAVCLHRYGKSRLADVILAGVDPHSYTAAMFAGQTLEQFNSLRESDLGTAKQLRQRAKAINFGIPGGLGAASLMTYARQTYGVKLALEEARKFRERLIHEVYPELADYLAGEFGSVTTLTGRTRGSVSYSQEKNTPFQGLAADGAKLALWQLISKGYQVAAFIHDEFVIELPEDGDPTAAAKEIDEICCMAMRQLTGSVLIACEYALCRRWYKQAVEVVENGVLVPWTPGEQG